MFQLEFGARPLGQQARKSSPDGAKTASGPGTNDPSLLQSNLLQSNSSEATLFRVWASRVQQVEVLLVEKDQDRESVIRSVPLEQVDRQLFEGIVSDCPPGSLYYYRLNQNRNRPDPCSRFQPFGVHGPSQVIDANRYRWQDSGWSGVAKQDLVIYEMHVGSFTPEGTYRGAMKKFPQLIELGVTAIELLPLVQTPGRWNWGYDGVHFFAPRNSYGSPDDLKCFIDTAHQMGLAVILDVVYNHVGPEGNYLNEFAHYRSPRHATPWGDSLNFDGPHSRPVRDFVIQNGLYWLDEFHFDGLRLDAIHYMFDQSELSIVDEFKQRFRGYAQSTGRKVWLIAESNIFDPLLLNDPAGNGDRYDGIWSDCLMHALYSLGKPDLRLTNRHYQGASDVLDALQYGYVFTIPQARRESPENRPPLEGNSLLYLDSLIMALQTHDSVGNHPHGKRIHQLISPQFQAAAAPLILLYPSIPMIFMGEEEASEAPFPFFADFEDPGLRRAVDRGRQDEYPHHHWKDSPLPSDPRAFHSSRLTPSAQINRMWRWYQQLLKLRQEGQREGWLSAACKQCSFEARRQLFTLSYHTGGQQVFVSCRLAAADAPPCEMILPDQAILLLDSWASLHPTDEGNWPASGKPEHSRRIPLQAEHCLIWRIA